MIDSHPFSLLYRLARLAFNSIDPNIPLGESMAFATLALSQLVHAYNIRSSHSLFRVGFHTNRYMLGAFLASCILMLAVLVLPFLQGVFEVIGMTGTQWGIVAILSIAPLIIMEIAKGIIKLLGNNR